MCNPRVYWHPAPYAPWCAWAGMGGNGWYDHHGWPWHHGAAGHHFGMAPVFGPVPAPPSTCRWRWPMNVTQEIAADSASSPQGGLVGGQTDVHLTLEYFVESGATAPAVKVTIESAGTTTTWDETSITAGFHTKEDFAALPPGAWITLEVTEATARLRWCETICC